MSINGAIAVVTSSGLEIIGARGTVRVAGTQAASPKWSPDGQTLAYLDQQPGRVWLSDRAGHSRMLLGQPVDSFAWSPAGGVVAAVPMQGSAPGGLLTVDTAGRTNQLVPSDFYVGSYKWSPDGGSIAYAEAYPGMSSGPTGRTDRLYVRSLASPDATLVPYDPGSGNGILLGAWWPDRQGLYLWSDPDHSGSIAADGLMLQAVSVPDGHATPVATTLPLPEVLAFSPDGAQVVVMKGASRFISETKSLTLCRTGTDTCSDLAQPSGTVSVEPSWSADGKSIVFVRGADTRDPDSTTWLPTTGLYLYDPGTGSARPVGGSPRSVGYPRFTADATQLVFQSGTGLMVLNLGTGTVRQLAAGLSPLYTQWGGAAPYAMTNR